VLRNVTTISNSSAPTPQWLIGSTYSSASSQTEHNLWENNSQAEK